MKSKVVFLFILMMAITVLVAGQTGEKTFKVGTAPTLRINTISGNATINSWDHPNEILVKWTIRGENVEPKIEQVDGQVLLSEKRPENVRHSGSVDYEVWAPEAAVVRGETVSGDLLLDGINGRIGIHTVSGDLTITGSTSTSLKLETVSGDIDCRFADLFDGDLSLQTVSGDVALSFGQGADARFEMSAISGDLDNTLKLDDVVKEKEFGMLHFAGRSGNGTGEVTIKTISGDVKLR